MPEDDRPRAKASAFWGPILGAARMHMTTQDMYRTIRDYAESAGVRLPSDIFSEVNRMRSLATGLARGSERLAKAGPGDALTGRMLGQQIYARSSLERSLAPAYHVRFEATMHTPDGPQTSWYTLEYSGSLPATVGELRAEVGAYAELLGDSYGTAVGELGAIELGEF